MDGPPNTVAEAEAVIRETTDSLNKAAKKTAYQMGRRPTLATVQGSCSP